jgi:hypothetical protein
MTLPSLPSRTNDEAKCSSAVARRSSWSFFVRPRVALVIPLSSAMRMVIPALDVPLWSENSDEPIQR